MTAGRLCTWLPITVETPLYVSYLSSGQRWTRWVTKGPHRYSWLSSVSAPAVYGSSSTTAPTLTFKMASCCDMQSSKAITHTAACSCKEERTLISDVLKMAKPRCTCQPSGMMYCVLRCSTCTGLIPTPETMRAKHRSLYLLACLGSAGPVWTSCRRSPVSITNTRPTAWHIDIGLLLVFCFFYLQQLIITVHYKSKIKHKSLQKSWGIASRCGITYKRNHKYTFIDV